MSTLRLSLHQHDMRGAPRDTGFVARAAGNVVPYRFMLARDVTVARLQATPARTVYVHGAQSGFVDRLRHEASAVHATVTRIGGARATPEASSHTVTFGTGDNPDCVDIRPTSALYGDTVHGLPDTGAVEQMHAAFARVRAALRQATARDRDGRTVSIGIRPTPERTGVDVLRTFMDAKAEFYRLPTDHRNIIVQSVQGRSEVFPHRGIIDDLFYYDHRRFYPRLLETKEFPIGVFGHYEVSDLVRDFKPSWYLITARVPDDWRGIGLVHHDGAWPSKPGTSFGGWYADPEVWMLRRHGWLQGVHQRLAPEDKSRAFRGVVGAMNAVEQACGDDVLARAWCREMRLGAIGWLRPRADTGREEAVSYEHFRAHEDELSERFLTFRQAPDGTRQAILTVDRESERPNTAPQVTEMIWAYARARVTQTMLDIPQDRLIGCHVDAIYTNAPEPFPYWTGGLRSNPFELKGHSTRRMRRPSDVPAMLAVFDGATPQHDTGAAHGA